MSTFLFLVIMMATGVLLWNTKWPKVATAGSWLFVIALAAVLWGMHPSVPGVLR